MHQGIKSWNKNVFNHLFLSCLQSNQRTIWQKPVNLTITQQLKANLAKI